MRLGPFALILVLPMTAQNAGFPPMPPEANQLLMNGKTDAFLAALRGSAGSGDVASMFWLGRSLEEIKGVPHDYAQALQWYRRAADMGLGVAAWSMGRLYEMGRGTSMDLGEAQRWYQTADQLGFRRTALSVINVRWFPGSQELEYEPVPDALRNSPAQGVPGFLNRVPPDLDAAELEMLRKSGVRGRLVWQGGAPGIFGLAARLVLIAQKEVTASVRLPLPEDGSVTYIQRDDGWQRLGTGRLTKRNLLIHPQSPEMPSITIIDIELEDGGTQGTTGWVWTRR
jgi:hypothetical protein